MLTVYKAFIHKQKRNVAACEIGGRVLEVTIQHRNKVTYASLYAYLKQMYYLGPILQTSILVYKTTQLTI